MERALRYIALVPLFLIPLIPLIVSQNPSLLFREADGAISAAFLFVISLVHVPFIPFGSFLDLFFPFITGKGFAFRMLVEIAFAAWFVLALVDARYRPRFSWTFVLFGALTLWMLIANLFAVNPHKAFWSNFERMEGWVTLIHLFLFFVVAGSVLSVHKLWSRWWLIFLAGSALVVMYGLFQIVGELETHQGGRIDATLGNAAYLPAYLLFGIAIALWQAVERTGWLRYALLALAALQTVILFYTATRGAFLGLLGAIVVGSILWLIEAKGAGRKIAVGALLAVVLLAGGLVAAREATFVTANPVLSRLGSAFNLESLKVRFQVWDIALKGAAERPVTGWGQEGFNYVFAKHYDPSLYAQEPWFDRAHNVFLDWLVAGGVPALLVFLAFLASILVALYRGPFTRIERVMVTSALIAYGIQGLAVFDNLFTYVPLLALAAMVHSRVARPIPVLERVPVANPITVPTAAAVTLVITIAVMWFVNVPNLQAANDLIHGLSGSRGVVANVAGFQDAVGRNSFASQEIAEQLVASVPRIVGAQGLSDDEKREFVGLAFSQMGREVARAPADPRLKLQLSSAYASIGDVQNALGQADAALRLSPQKQTTLLQRGILLWQAGAYQDARDTFREAYELDTSFSGLATYAAAGEIAAGNILIGKALLVSTHGTTTVDSEPLRIAYYEAKQYEDLIAIEKLRVKNSRGTPDARFNLAIAYSLVGRTTEALAEVQATVAAHPETATTAALVLREIEKNATAKGK